MAGAAAIELGVPRDGIFSSKTAILYHPTEVSNPSGPPTMPRLPKRAKWCWSPRSARPRPRLRRPRSGTPGPASAKAAGISPAGVAVLSVGGAELVDEAQALEAAGIVDGAEVTVQRSEQKAPASIQLAGADAPASCGTGELQSSPSAVVAALEAKVAASGTGEDNPKHLTLTSLKLKLTGIVKGIQSGAPAKILKSATECRELLANERNPPIQEVIDAGLVPVFAQLLACRGNPAILFEAAWALTTVCCGTHDQTRAVIGANTLPLFVQLLVSDVAGSSRAASSAAQSRVSQR